MTIELHNKDCLDVMAMMPGNSINVTVTSPPYDDLRSYNDGSVWGEHTWKASLKDLYRITKRGGVVVWNVADATVGGSETGTSFKQALYAVKCGFSLHDTMIYIKDNVNFPENTRYFSGFEYMFIFSKGAPKTFNPIKDRRNKWAGTIIHGTDRQKDGTTKPIHGAGKEIKDYGMRFNWWKMDNKQKCTGHPAPMPSQMAHDHIISWSEKQDIILDPFMGGGTTGIACVNTNRNFIGIEKDEAYFNIAKQRIENTQRPLI